MSRWKDAARWVARFTEGVVTGTDGTGYPVSVRQLALAFDPATGELPLVVPESLGMREGPACFICHFHDDGMWNLRAIQLKGRVELRGGKVVFVTTAFTPPSVPAMMRNMRRSMNGYLERRNLPRPEVNWDAIRRIWERARRIENP